MVTNSIIRHLLSDKNTLQDFQNAKIPTLEDVKRRMFLLERNENKNIPDHYYKLLKEKSFIGIENYNELFTVGLCQLAKKYLFLRENKIYVKQEKQNQWQELITRIPPLILQMAFISDEKFFPTEDPVFFFRSYILPNTKYTSIPSPYIPQLESLLRVKEGLHDLHIHLNGTAETDVVWNDILYNPIKHLSFLSNSNILVKEQFEQENIFSPKELLSLFYIAINLRNKFHSYVKQDRLDYQSPSELLTKILNTDSKETTFWGNPFSLEIGANLYEDTYPMAIEGLMYIEIFNFLKKNQHDTLAQLFHFYLLILGIVHRLIVQQTHQFGFYQFQKITQNKIREFSESKGYKSRFFQLAGNELKNIKHIEGRFSPKKSIEENRKIISDITSAWKTFYANVSFTPPTLTLIAHFIKEKESSSDRETFRHNTLRKKIKKIAWHLKDFKNEISGIDAASNEFDTTVDVFSPVFRFLRRKGFRHFTYHAGEDFFHILSGLRSIYETVFFLEMDYGDRIGHACAAGITPQKWINVVGKELLLRQGEYLDDLVFAYSLIVRSENSLLKSKIPFLTRRIAELSFNVYNENFEITSLEKAWKLRKYCPSLLLDEVSESSLTCLDVEEWETIKKLSLKENKNDQRIKLLELYHRARWSYEKIIEVKTEEVFSAEDLVLLQLEILKILHNKEIIIEALPTSNVRIGYYDSYDDYHLYNWLKWEKEGFLIPPIIIGTDDTGIFATNIYNEYANIYCNLTKNKMNRNIAMDFIKKLDDNANIYKF